MPKVDETRESPWLLAPTCFILSSFFFFCLFSKVGGRGFAYDLESDVNLIYFSYFYNQLHLKSCNRGVLIEPHAYVISGLVTLSISRPLAGNSNMDRNLPLISLNRCPYLVNVIGPPPHLLSFATLCIAGANLAARIALRTVQSKTETDLHLWSCP